MRLRPSGGAVFVNFRRRYENVLLVAENVAVLGNVLPHPELLAAERIDSHQIPHPLETNHPSVDRTERIDPSAAVDKTDAAPDSAAERCVDAVVAGGVRKVLAPENLLGIARGMPRIDGVDLRTYIDQQQMSAASSPRGSRIPVDAAAIFHEADRVRL